MTRRAIGLAVGLVTTMGSSVMAQVITEPPLIPRHSFEIAGGLDWFGGFDLGVRTASLPRNPTTGTGSFILFTSDGRQEAFPAGWLTVGYHLSETFLLEAAGSLSRPRPRISITSDAELQNGATLSTEGLTEYTVGGSLVIHLTKLAIGTRTLPFVRAGAELIKQVQGGAVEDGRLYYAGGGLRYVLISQNRRPSTFGVRGEARVNLRDGAFALSDDDRVYASIGAGLFVTF